MPLFSDYNIYIMFWVGVFGLCLGSFYNVVALRSLSNESIVYPPSKCPKCEHRLFWWHNIPVLSYIILRGKCWFCKEKISIQYPIVELITMGLFLWSYNRFGLSLEFLFNCIICSLLLIMSVTDIKEQVVDCKLATTLGIIGLIYNFILSVQNGIQAGLGLLVGVAILEGFAQIGKLFTKKRIMGEADTYVAGAIGACFGIHNILYILLYSLFASLIFILPMYMYKQYKAKRWSSCIFLVLFCISVVLYTYIFNYYTLSFLFISGICFAVSVLKGYNADNKIGTYAPFVPALALGTLFFIFFI